MDRNTQVKVENARLLFRNFAGKGSNFNTEGDRNFSIILDPTTAEQMLKDGWNVKYLESREEGEANTPILKITVKFTFRPPRIVMITSGGKTDLGKENVEVLDWADIANAELIFVPYEWEVGNKTGIAAYLKTLVVTIEEDELERKYGLNRVDEIVETSP